uniref:Fanconi-associated nuclease n=1 Tax=Aegilops tauschii subsp. strangulata TaxID=200361 RepID=A0A453QV10_AEGTS
MPRLRRVHPRLGLLRQHPPRDICLSRGAKRKLTQSSLLDFRFSKKTTAEPTPDILNNSDEAENKGLTDGDVSTDREFSSMNGVTGSPKDSGTTSLTGCLHGSPGISKTLNTCIPSNAGLPIIKNAENDDAVEKASSCLLSAGTTSVSIDACPDADSSTTVAVDTVIVGRRFRESFELQEGMGITVVRDPQNAKDPDAVKGLTVGRCLDICLESWLKSWLLYWTHISWNARDLWLVCLNNSLTMCPSS